MSGARAALRALLLGCGQERQELCLIHFTWLGDCESRKNGPRQAVGGLFPISLNHVHMRVSWKLIEERTREEQERERSSKAVL